MVRKVLLVFEDSDFDKLKEVKDGSGLSWDRFVLMKAGVRK